MPVLVYIINQRSIYHPPSQRNAMSRVKPTADWNILRQTLPQPGKDMSTGRTMRTNPHMDRGCTVRVCGCVNVCVQWAGGGWGYSCIMADLVPIERNALLINLAKAIGCIKSPSRPMQLHPSAKCTPAVNTTETSAAFEIKCQTPPQVPDIGILVIGLKRSTLQCH